MGTVVQKKQILQQTLLFLLQICVSQTLIPNGTGGTNTLTNAEAVNHNNIVQPGPHGNVISGNNAGNAVLNVNKNNSPQREQIPQQQTQRTGNNYVVENNPNLLALNPNPSELALRNNTNLVHGGNNTGNIIENEENKRNIVIRLQIIIISSIIGKVVEIVILILLQKGMILLG